MKTLSFSALVFAVLLGSLGGGVTTYFLLGPDPADSRRLAEPRIERPVAGPPHELLERMDALLAENRDLRERLAVLELQPAPEYRVPVEGFVSKEAFEKFREEVRAALARRAQPASEPAELKEQVAGALIEIRQEEAQEAVRKYHEKRAARLEQDIEKITEWLDLSSYQANEMRGVLQKQYAREDEVRRLWEEGTDDELLGERKRSDRERFRTEVAQVLTPEQFDTFWARISGEGKQD